MARSAEEIERDILRKGKEQVCKAMGYLRAAENLLEQAFDAGPPVGANSDLCWAEMTVARVHETLKHVRMQYEGNGR